MANNTTDQGGVHLNSGVPNHAYALLVDGVEHLRDADEASFDTLLALLEDASAEWATQEVPFWAFLSLPDEEFAGALD